MKTHSLARLDQSTLQPLQHTCKLAHNATSNLTVALIAQIMSRFLLLNSIQTILRPLTLPYCTVNTAASATYVRARTYTTPHRTSHALIAQIISRSLLFHSVQTILRLLTLPYGTMYVLLFISIILAKFTGKRCCY